MDDMLEKIMEVIEETFPRATMADGWCDLRDQIRDVLENTPVYWAHLDDLPAGPVLYPEITLYDRNGKKTQLNVENGAIVRVLFPMGATL